MTDKTELEQIEELQALTDEATSQQYQCRTRITRLAEASRAKIEDLEVRLRSDGIVVGVIPGSRDLKLTAKTMQRLAGWSDKHLGPLKEEP